MNPLNSAFVFALSLLITTAGATQTTDSAGLSAASTSDELPSGWTARPDQGGESDRIKFVVMEPGYHLTLGPATILYRSQDRPGGPFHAVANFHQM
jgi:hypothetical protein